MKHVIKKQVLEFKLLTTKDIFRMQQKASQYYYSHILPVIEKVLNGYTDDDHVIQIDKLEVDLGIMEWEEGKQEIKAEDLFQKIEKETKKVVQHILDQQYLDSRYGKKDVVLKKPVVHHACEQWLYYMRNGYLPWNVCDVSEQWRMNVLEALATDYTLISEIKLLIETDDNVRQRLINDHSVSFLVKLMEVLTATGQYLLPQWIHEIKMVLNQGDKKQLHPDERPVGKSTNRIWNQFLKGAVEGLSNIDITKKILQEGLMGKQWKDVELYKDDMTLLWPVIETFKDKFLSLTDDPIVLDKRNKNKEFDELMEDAKHNITPVKREAEIKKGKHNETELPADGIFVSHAGLILLHPFLKHLFLHTGLIENGKFTGTDTQEKAIWLLHFIATGNTVAEEYQLVVPKILCGYPLDQSPANNIELEEAVKTEAVDMMNVAIEQWTILKNTSVDGLREGFLQRNGKIYKKNDDTCFALEPHAIDVLLDHLPWNLSIVKLPWIKEFIKVEWR